MAADSRRRSDQAAQACMTCKTRKKKCNKSLPSCGYCIRKELSCSYGSVSACKNSSAASWGTRASLDAISARLIVPGKAPINQGESGPYCNQVHIQVRGIIRGTGQFIDEVISRYFSGFHRHLPVISRARLNNSLIARQTVPAADVSALLLAICLINCAPALGYHPVQTVNRFIEQESLYLTTRSLLAQVQVSCQPSIHIVHAGLLLAVYEYIQGRPDDAFVTISGTVRTAYTVRIHTHDHSKGQIIYAPSCDVERVEEAANTWWGIVICERIFYSEVTVLDQPLLTLFPDGHSRLPIEPEVFDHLDLLDAATIPNIPLSCLTSPKVGGFSRTAQATCLLDQVVKSFGTPDIDSRFLQLDRLDTNIQEFLSLVMPQCQGRSGIFCESMNIAIRALFLLHWHILDQFQAVRANFKSIEKWHSRSQDALNTVTKMVIDIAHSLITLSPTNTATQLIDGMPPMYPYIARAALQHIRSSIQREDIDWMASAENVVQTSLDKYLQRWGATRE